MISEFKATVEEKEKIELVYSRIPRMNNYFQSTLPRGSYQDFVLSSLIVISPPHFLTTLSPLSVSLYYLTCVYNSVECRIKDKMSTHVDHGEQRSRLELCRMGLGLFLSVHQQ